LTAELSALHRELVPTTPTTNGNGTAPVQQISLSDSELLDRATRAKNGANIQSVRSKSRDVAIRACVPEARGFVGFVGTFLDLVRQYTRAPA